MESFRSFFSRHWFVVTLSAYCGIAVGVAVSSFDRDRGPDAVVIIENQNQIRNDFESERGWLPVRLTAYCACEKCCGRWARFGLTKSGVRPRQGVTVAADPKVWPLGSVLLVRGIGYVRVEDTGSGVMGPHLDIYLERHQDALDFGVKDGWVCPILIPGR